MNLISGTAGPRALAAGLALTLLLLLAGCIELTGQRITVRHDAASDRLYVLLEYDGIHNSDEDKQRAAERKLRAFVENGDVMLFDWYGHIKRRGLNEQAIAVDVPPRERAFLEHLLERTHVTILGTYRDADGRLGAAQMVVFDAASDLIELANGAISEAVLALPNTTDDHRWDRTLGLWKTAAARGHAWLAFSGHAVVFRFPSDAADWARAKLAFFAKITKDAAAASPEDAAAMAEHPLLKLLAALPLSVEQGAAATTIRFGHQEQPWTVRCAWRDVDSHNVDALVQELVPGRLDAALAARLLDAAPTSVPADRVPVAPRSGAGGTEIEHLQQVLTWGPVENRVRAVLGRAAGKAAPDPAFAWLAAFAEEWNAAGRQPAAPAPELPREAAPDAWRAWYRTLVRQPTL
ncbi:MAG: hypothetical protein AAF628_35845 [Planctomycetota bacterium]